MTDYKLYSKLLLTPRTKTQLLNQRCHGGAYCPSNASVPNSPPRLDTPAPPGFSATRARDWRHQKVNADNRPCHVLGHDRRLCLAVRARVKVAATRYRSEPFQRTPSLRKHASGIKDAYPSLKESGPPEAPRKERPARRPPRAAPSL